MIETQEQPQRHPHGCDQRWEAVPAVVPVHPNHSRVQSARVFFFHTRQKTHRRTRASTSKTFALVLGPSLLLCPPSPPSGSLEVHPRVCYIRSFGLCVRR